MAMNSMESPPLWKYQSGDDDLRKSTTWAVIYLKKVWGTCQSKPSDLISHHKEVSHFRCKNCNQQAHSSQECSLNLHHNTRMSQQLHGGLSN